MLVIPFLSELELTQTIFSHLVQKLGWTLPHLCLLKMSGLPKTPGVGKITFDFMVRMLAAGSKGAVQFLFKLHFKFKNSAVTLSYYSNLIYFQILSRCSLSRQASPHYYTSLLDHWFLMGQSLVYESMNHLVTSNHSNHCLIFASLAVFNPLDAGSAGLSADLTKFHCIKFVLFLIIWTRFNPQQPWISLIHY